MDGITKNSELIELQRQIALLQEEKSELVSRVRELSIQGKEKSSLIKNIFDYLPNGVVMFDHNRNVIQVNQATADIFGLDKRLMIGKNCTELFSCYNKTMSCPVLDRQQSVNKLRTDTHNCDRLLLRSAVLNKDGDGSVVIESLVDITELENATREKVLALQTKSNFLANVSHELRTPMHGILGCSNLLTSKKDQLPDKFQIYLETLNTSAGRLWALIEQIFEASNLEDASIKIQKSAFELDTFFKDIEAEFRMSIDEYKNEVVFINELTNQRIVCDAMRLRQIMMILLENAAKYTSKGRIECRLMVIDADHQSSLQIEVKDNGVGIDPGRQQYIFNMFEQENGAENRQYQGAGLGLAIAQQLARLMGGSIDLESEPGKGSTFRLIIPVDFKK